MLRLKNLMKSYTTAGFTQNALDGVSVAFRSNEFAAVLGPSGSGKTTMLNIIGGLDRYDSGDLVIDDISTKNYKASDWDTYRNNRIGFVFQSYNLIPHQSVLANVELALTLSGVSKSERRRRAKDALAEVGLKEHVRKKPGQLSGGQMQRVAIARAIINDPEILLADEPTGALDTTTSKQVMELLTRIAKDRLVIMVTHNNELAEKYANRIIHLTDGKVVSDSKPFDPDKEEKRVAREPRRASMSFFTAIMLSFSNLMTKKGRTFTTAFAGSIGIIGIGTILAFSNGINAYIKNIEEETLSIYPLAIQDQGFDLSSFFGGENHDERVHGRGRERPPGTVREMQIMQTVFSTQSLNDLASLKNYFEENRERLDRYATTVHYMYEITPQIYLADTSKGIDQINPDSIFSAMMTGSDIGPQAAMSFMPSMNVFAELPNNPDLYETQYDLLAGHWPENYDESVLVLSFGGRITDFALFSMGIRDRAEMRAMLESILQRSDMEVELSESEGFYTYERLMAAGFKVIHPAEHYEYDETFNVWVDKSNDNEFMEELIKNGIDLKIVGIVQPNQDATATVLSEGVNYTPGLILHLMESASTKKIVKEQLSNPEVNVLSGNTFAHERDNPESSFDFSRIISIDEELLSEAMQLDSLFDSMDFSNMDFGSLDLSGFDMSGMDFGNIDFGDIMGDIGDMSDLFGNIDMSDIPPPAFDIAELTQIIAAQINIPPQAITAIMSNVMGGFLSDVMTNNPTLLMPPIDQAALSAAFDVYMSNPTVQAAIMAELSQYIDPTTLETQISAAIQAYMMAAMQEYMAQMAAMIELQMSMAMQAVVEQITQSIQTAMAQMARQMQSAMSGMSGQIERSITAMLEEMMEEMSSAMQGFDSEVMAEAFQIDISEEAIFALMTSIMNPTTTSYDQNLSKLGYADPGVPMQILIYPRSFEAKQEIIEILDEYNAKMEQLGQTEKVVHFTDFVGLMMSSVTNIIDMVSYALVAFVSVALVVSSIMIGVITFISVLERKKEIGILRAVGASKGNIRLVFNAETLIIGFVAGVIGVLATLLIAIVANIIILNALDIEQLVLMPPVVPFLLVAVSMFLTYVAGLIPASAAAGKPPVDALRSE
ncbi:MAG: ATP-binding cassette domain-containing protein [Oscillospiraceae bacterium]|nr:ATP-binding cassette domain-containing protein [Oscillospiraceae bacterium]